LNELFHFCRWLNETRIAISIRQSDVAFPVIETVHVLGITVLAGTVAMVDLRLLGIILKKDRVSEVARLILPLTWIGFGLMFVSGSLLFAAEAVKSYDNPAFRLKMLLLIVAGVNPLIFHATVFRDVADWDQATVTPWRARAAAVISLTIWSLIIMSGRAIAYF
jgi:hypothetical protein